MEEQKPENYSSSRLPSSRGVATHLIARRSGRLGFDVFITAVVCISMFRMIVGIVRKAG